jgi:hypothetical protein
MAEQGRHASEAAEVIAAVVASVAALLLGWPLAAAADRDERASLARRLGESYLLGAALAAGVLFALSLLHVAWSVGAVVATAAAISATVAWIARKRLRVRAFGGVSIIDAVTLLFVAGYARFATMAPTVEADFVTIWGIKAKEFWYAAGIDWRFLEHPFNEFAHVDYPLLVPLLFDWHALLAGAWPERWLGVVNVSFGVATLLVVRSFFDEELRERWLCAVATLALVPAALSPWIGLAEGPLVAYGTAGLLHIRRGNVARGAVYLGVAAMCKNEGLTLIVAAAGGLLVASGVRRLVQLWPAAAIAVPWLVIRSAHHLHGDLATGSAPARVVEHLAHLQPMFAAMVEYPLGKPVLWLGIVAALLIGARELGSRERFLAVTVLLQLLFFIGAYLVTPHDVTWHVRWSWERIVNQLTAPLLFLSIVLLSRNLLPARISEQRLADG